MTSFELSPIQKRTLAAAVTLLAAVFVLSVVGLALYWIARFLQYFSNVLMPLAVAAIVALVIRPYYDLLLSWTGRRPVIAVLLVYLTFILPIIAFSWFFGALIVKEFASLAEQISHLFHRGWAFVQTQWPQWQAQLQDYDWASQLRELLEERADLLSHAAMSFFSTSVSMGATVFHFITGLVGWIIFPIYLAFFLAAPTISRDRIEELLPFFRAGTRKDIVYLGTEFVNILVSFFRGQLIVALLQGLLYAVGFSLIGLEYGFILGLVLGLLNIIPYLGSILGLVIMVPLGLFQPGGGVLLASGAVAVFTVVQLIESYFLTPRIMGDRTGLHPLAIIVAIFFWGTAFGGIWGMILAIPLTAFGVVFWRLLKEKYIPELV